MTTGKPGASAGRKAAPKAAAKASASAPFEPMSFAKRDEAAEADQVVLFEVDGIEYTVPAVIPTGQALQYLAITNGMETEALRGMYLLRVLAGEAAFNALLGSADMTGADWHQLISILSEHVFGGLEGPGN